MSSSHFPRVGYCLMPATSCCLQLSVKGGGGGGLFFCFLAGLEGAAGVMKRYVWRIEAKGEEASCVAMKRGEEMRARQRGGKSVKKCRVEGFGRAESALMQTLWGASHTHTQHTHTPVHSHPASFAVALLRISSISGCHTGQSRLLEQRLPVALWGYYMV